MNSTSKTVAQHIVMHAYNPPTMTDLELEIWKARRAADAKRHFQILLLDLWLESHPDASATSADSINPS